MKKTLHVLSPLLVLLTMAGCLAPPRPEPQKRSLEATGDRVVVKNVRDLSPVFNPELGSARFEEIFSGAWSDIDTEYSITRVILPTGASLAEHTLAASETIYVLAGGGMLKVNGASIVLEPGKAVYIPAGSVQSTLNNSDKNLVFLTVISPPYDPVQEKIIGKPADLATPVRATRVIVQEVEKPDAGKTAETAIPKVDKRTLMDDAVPREELKKIEQNIDQEISVGKTISRETEQLIPRAPDTARPVDLKNVQQLTPREEAAPTQPSQ